MKRRFIVTILWMVVFAAVTFWIIPITFVVIALSRIISEASLKHVLWLLRLIFVASPFVALALGLRGSLPGTKALAATERSTDTMPKILPLIVLVIFVLFTLGAWVAFLPRPGRPNVAITFLGYTNDTTGTRLAKIAVRNLNATTIFAYAPRIEIWAPRDARGYEDYFSGVNCPWHSTLDPGASGSFTIPPPTNQLPWRLAFYVYPDRGRGVKNTMKNVVSIACLSVGLWPMFERFLPLGGAFRMPYTIEGNWIKNEG